MFTTVTSLLFAAFLIPTLAQDSPTVLTDQGQVVGIAAQDGEYYAYYGIPYAGSTDGVNRFKAPPPPPNFPGIFHAVDSSKICAQPTARGLIGEENCLYLNIFTKNVTTPKPVMVWIEGEDYTRTLNNFQHTPRRIVEEDVVFVAINYRLSIFGFLCLGVEDAPGNAGLKDIIAGLKWINRNIAGFGGDPNNVVLFGHGSGAAMVDLITLSPMATNLVHKAIASSGSALAPWAVAYDPVGYAALFGESVAYSGKSRDALAKAFLETDLQVLGSALQNFEFRNNTPLFAPCIEDVRLNPNDTFLHDAPINILRSGNYSHIPYITGYLDREGTLRVQQALFSGWLDQMQQNFTNFIQADLAFNSEQNRTNATQSIREFYFGTRVINQEVIEDYFDYQGDTMFLVSILRGIRERAATSSEPVRLYQFTFRGTGNSDWAYPISLTGARHGSILNFLFDYDLITNEETMQRYVVSRWTAFAKTGVPDPVPQNANSTEVLWPTFNNLTMSYLSFYGEHVAVNATVIGVTLGSNPHQERRQFWDQIHSLYYVAPTSVSSSHRIVGASLTVLCFVAYFI